MSDALLELHKILQEIERLSSHASHLALAVIVEVNDERRKCPTHGFAPRPAPVPMCAEAMDDLGEGPEA